MKNLFAICISTLICFTVSAQINMADSTVQAIGYWDKKEKQSYAITTDKYKLKGADTTSKEHIRYDVDITILDSTSKSYKIEWFYKNFIIDSDNEMMKDMMSVAKDLKVIILTDENGSFSEVVNWQDVRDYIKKSTDRIRAKYKDVKAMNDFIKQMEKVYSTKEAIESSAISDIQQFYTFFGAKYKLNEQMEGKIKVSNMFGGEPFDCDVVLYLDEINKEDNNYIIRATQSVDKKQLTEATYNFIADLATKMGAEKPKREMLKDLNNETVTASRIHNTGWVIYSIQTKTVTTDPDTSIEETVIELKD
jgi:hypothetical protein